MQLVDVEAAIGEMIAHVVAHTQELVTDVETDLRWVLARAIARIDDGHVRHGRTVAAQEQE